MIRRAAPPAPHISPDEELAEMQRRIDDWLGPHADVELVVQGMKLELQALKGRRW